MYAGGQLASVAGLVAGTWDADVVDDLGWTPADLTVDKCRLDPFLWTRSILCFVGLGWRARWHVGSLPTSVWSPRSAVRSCGTIA